MRPFGIFLGAAALTLGLTLYVIITPANWVTDYTPAPWVTTLDYVLATVLALAGVFMVRIYGEVAWITAAMTIAFSATALLTLFQVSTTFNPERMGKTHSLQIVRGIVYVFYLLSGIFAIIGMLCVKAREIRTPFRWLGRLSILEFLVGFGVQYYNSLHSAHLSILAYVVAVPGRVIATWLNYRFWRGDLGRTVGWEKEVETLGEEV